MTKVNERKTHPLYIGCDWCGRSLTASWICIWTEDKQGQSHNVAFLHYKCREEYELENPDKGKWFSRGQRPVVIEL